MDKTDKRIAVNLNIAFSLSHIYFILFYSMGIQLENSIEMKPSSEVLIEALSKVIHFLFQSESGMIPLAVFSFSLIVVAILGLLIYRSSFSKVTTAMLCLGFVPALAPILCNMFFGPITDENSSNVLWLSITILLIIYLIVFQILFYKDYKKIKD